MKTRNTSFLLENLKETGVHKFWGPVARRSKFCWLAPHIFSTIIVVIFP